MKKEKKTMIIIPRLKIERKENQGWFWGEGEANTKLESQMAISKNMKKCFKTSNTERTPILFCKISPSSIIIGKELVF